jgi:hypothetical protein
MFPMLAKKFREEKKEETPATSKGKNSMENGSYETKKALQPRPLPKSRYKT